MKRFETKTGKKPIIGTMAGESNIRRINYERFGCNAFDLKRPTSNPLSFWNEQDVWDYIKEKNLNYSEIYDMGYERTGCMFCLFGLHFEKGETRLDLLKKTHPKKYEYIMDKLGFDEVLKWYPKKERIK